MPNFDIMTKIDDIPLVPVVVESLKEIARQVYVLEFKRFFDFEAGQVIKLAWDKSWVPRLYSIASGENDTNIQLLFNLVDDGTLTPKLASIRPGHKLFASKAFGKFTCGDGPAVWIAAGTGIAPFASMFRSGMKDDKILIHGGKYHDSFYYSDEFAPVLKENYVRCSSQEEVEGAFYGRLTKYLREKDDLPERAVYYLCGSSEMVVETRDILISKGIKFGQIVSEIYF
jgi:ferredoxin--NADP+ reductase